MNRFEKVKNEIKKQYGHNWEEQLDKAICFAVTNNISPTSVLSDMMLECHDDEALLTWVDDIMRGEGELPIAIVRRLPTSAPIHLARERAH